MNIRRIFIFTLLLTAACESAPDLGRAKSTVLAEKPFIDNLRKGYIELSEEEWEQKDKKDAKLYSRKALFTTHGINPSLAGLENRKLPADKLNELAVERNYLITAFAKGVYDEQPKAAAKAQIMFECWVEEEEEAKYPDKTKFCKNEYFSAKTVISELLRQKEIELKVRERKLAKREKALQENQKMLEASMVAMQRRKIAESRQMPEPYIVFFGFNSTKLTSAAKDVLDQVAEEVSYFRPEKIISSGHTDSIGNAEYNMELSGRRGQAIADYLISKSMPENLFDVRYYGENDKRVDTPDERNEAANRYGRITFVKRFK